MDLTASSLTQPHAPFRRAYHTYNTLVFVSLIVSRSVSVWESGKSAIAVIEIAEFT